MTERSEAQKLIAKLEANADRDDLLIACLISDLKEYDQEKQHVDHLQALHDHHRQLISARTSLIVEAAIVRREQAIGAHWTTPIEADMPAVYPL